MVPKAKIKKAKSKLTAPRYAQDIPSSRTLGKDRDRGRKTNWEIATKITKKCGDCGRDLRTEAATITQKRRKKETHKHKK